MSRKITCTVCFCTYTYLLHIPTILHMHRPHTYSNIQSKPLKTERTSQKRKRKKIVICAHMDCITMRTLSVVGLGVAGGRTIGRSRTLTAHANFLTVIFILFVVFHFPLVRRRSVTLFFQIRIAAHIGFAPYIMRPFPNTTFALK